jgi:methyltransferase (TIGR00027 family)
MFAFLKWIIPIRKAWKKECLQAASISIPDSVRFVSVDFEEQSLDKELKAAGFRADRSAFFSWLGVVPYLTREAAAHTFGFIGSLPKGSGVVFDYTVSRSSIGVLQRLALGALSRRVARAGEPFRLFFEPGELDKFLRRFGFQAIEQLSSLEINERYFWDRKDGLRVAGAAGRIVGAWV